MGTGASLEANAAILRGIRIGDRAMAGAGSVVTRDVAEHALVLGNPDRKRGYVCYRGHALDFVQGGEGTQTGHCPVCERDHRLSGEAGF